MTKMWSPLHTRLEDFILRGLEKGKTIFNVVGSSSTAASSLVLSQALSKEFSDLPRLVVVSSLDVAQKFQEELRFFNPEFRCFVLQPWDVSPFSGLYPSPEVRNSRTSFIYWAGHAQKNDIFIASISAIMQLSVPFFSFSKRCKKLQKNDELPTNLAQFLNALGYQSAAVVEDVGQYSVRGGIVDIFSPAERFPVRLELFGDQIESLRYFSISDQRSLEEVSLFNLSPVYEFALTDENIETIIKNLRNEFKKRELTPAEADEAIRSISLKNYFIGSDLLLPYCYEQLSSVLDHFSSGLNIFSLDVADISRAADEFIQELESDRRANLNNNSVLFCPEVSDILSRFDQIPWPEDSRRFNFSNLSFLNDEAESEERIAYNSLPLTEFSQLAQNLAPASDAWIAAAQPRLKGWLSAENKIFIAAKNQMQVDRLKALLAKMDIVVCSLHSSLRQDRQKITDRLIQAMSNPNVDIIAHPTGRIINNREPADLDMRRVFKVAHDTGTALEINSGPDRLDLKAEHVQAALDEGVKLVISSDSHSVSGLAMLEYGVITARRGGARASEILNTLELDQLLANLKH